MGFKMESGTSGIGERRPSKWSCFKLFARSTSAACGWTMIGGWTEDLVRAEEAAFSTVSLPLETVVLL